MFVTNGTRVIPKLTQKYVPTYTLKKKNLDIEGINSGLL